MRDSTENHLTVQATVDLPFPAESIWPLLCPVREYDWLEGWQCSVLHSVSGANEFGCVFSTAFASEGGLEVWTTSRYEPEVCLEFVRTNALRTILLRIDLHKATGRTTMNWSQQITALSDSGVTYLQEKPLNFERQMMGVKKSLHHYLSTGTKLIGVNRK